MTEINTLFSMRTHYSWFQVDEHGSRDVFSSSCLAEESVERVVPTAYGFVAGHLTIGLDSVFQAVKLPASVSNLNTGLADMNREALTLKKGDQQYVNIC